MTQDEQYLNLLSIFHYVLGGITAVFSCVPFIHVAVGVAMLSGAFEGENSPPRILGWFLIFIPAAIILCGWTLAVLMAIVGRRLKRVSYTFCLVIAGIECIFIPLGTVLGVYTIIVLVKDSVRELFRERKDQDTFGRS
jgi:hypothetical protein